MWFSTKIWGYKKPVEVAIVDPGGVVPIRLARQRPDTQWDLCIYLHENPPKLPGFVGKYTSHVIYIYILFKPTKQVWFYPGPFRFFGTLTTRRRDIRIRPGLAFLVGESHVCQTESKKRGGCFQMFFRFAPKFGGFTWSNFSRIELRVEIWSWVNLPLVGWMCILAVLHK